MLTSDTTSPAQPIAQWQGFYWVETILNVPVTITPSGGGGETKTGTIRLIRRDASGQVPRDFAIFLGTGLVAMRHGGQITRREFTFPLAATAIALAVDEYLHRLPDVEAAHHRALVSELHQKKLIVPGGS